MPRHVSVMPLNDKWFAVVDADGKILARTTSLENAKMLRDEHDAHANIRDRKK